MNTRASVAYGWGVLILAGGGAYYFAKRSINADRADRAASIEKERQKIEKLRQAEYGSPPSRPVKRNQDVQRDPSIPNNHDPAPVAHEQDQNIPKSKYEASAPFRSRKGDRFS